MKRNKLGSIRPSPKQVEVYHPPVRIELQSVMTDYWVVLPMDENTGYCEIETVTRGYDVPDKGYFVAVAYPPSAQQIAAEHNLILKSQEAPQ